MGINRRVTYGYKPNLIVNLQRPNPQVLKEASRWKKQEINVEPEGEPQKLRMLNDCKSNLECPPQTCQHLAEGRKDNNEIWTKHHGTLVNILEMLDEVINYLQVEMKENHQQLTSPVFF